MVVGTGMAAREGAEVVLDMERLDKIDILSAEELQDVGDKTGTDIGFRHQHAHVFVKPLRVEARAAAGSAERSLVYVVIDIAVHIVLLGQFLDAKGGLHAADELVVFYIVHHFVLRAKFIGTGLYFFVRKRLYFSAIIGVWKIVDLRPNLGEKVVIVDIGAPHGLVHIGHEAHVGLPQD